MGDEPGNRKVAFTVVFVMVLDENDNSPYFIFPAVNCSVQENLPPIQSMPSTKTPGHMSSPPTPSCPPASWTPAVAALTGRRSLPSTALPGTSFDFEWESDYCFMVEARDNSHRAGPGGHRRGGRIQSRLHPEPVPFHPPGERQGGADGRPRYGHGS